ncbi:ribonuclease D [Algisphaera agarilytica]|uniref:Ribonuclease D n=1 Tax=Algisphaera agarilytica TaxID=1385975 RepID=A0A7X0H8K1_9BACT|nr:HRDC domain-containing protein [Algisphaera agarilytica]MBB6429789.1 ribonuclease D [Algisphaera agarilytica]
MPGKRNLKTNGGWPNYRSPHRQRADAEAHAEQAAPPPVVEHDLVPDGELGVVETQDALLKLIDELRDAGRFGYDTEFIGEETFYSRFCVVQVSTPEKITLIDALAPGIDLLPFWELLAEPAVEKIVHAGLQDMEPVQRLTGKPPANVFDTQIAAAFAGQPYPMSQAKLCLAVAEADLGKSSKFSQWDRRPLTPHQKQYAANDVRYLHLVRHRIGKRLDEMGHADKARTECQQFSDPSIYRVEPLEMKLKAKGGGTLNRKEQAIVNALLLWRAEVAEERNLPMRMLLEDQILVDLAKTPVTSASEVASFKGMPWPVKEAYAQTLVDLTAAALAGPLPKRKRGYKPLSDTAQARLDELWEAAQAHCDALSIAPSMVFTKRELTALVRAEEKGKAPPTGLRIGTGWRREVLEPVLGALL